MPPSEHHSPILIIMGSVRAGRRCPQIANWVCQVARAASPLPFEVVDLKDWPLPADDEPGIPASGHYTQPHTKAWAKKIGAAGGYILVTPQYNWGYPAPLKNALDHLSAEWRGKPVAIVTYGGSGGGKCAAQLRQVAEGMKMRPAPTMPEIAVDRALIGTGQPQAPEDLHPFEPALRQAIRELEGLMAVPVPA